MILFGCLLAFSAAVAPRVVLVLAWIFSDRWAKVWEGDFLLPILGIIFLPYTTIMYMLTVTLAVGGGVQPLQGWDWLWIILGLFLDFMKWSQMLTNRKEAAKQTQKYYPSGAPGASAMSGGSSASGSAAAASSAAAPAASAAPAAPAASPEPTPAAAPAATPAESGAESPSSDAGADETKDSS